MQYWGNATGGSTCPDPVTGNPTYPCTQNCEVLGVGIPIWELQDPDNPVTGGIKVSYVGAPSSGQEPYPCPYNNVTGADGERSATILLHCAPELPLDSLIVLNVSEVAACQYVIEARTQNACGCEPNCFQKDCGDNGCGGIWCVTQADHCHSCSLRRRRRR